MILSVNLPLLLRVVLRVSEQPGQLNYDELAVDCNVHPLTIRRMLSSAREYLRLNVVYDRKTKGLRIRSFGVLDADATLNQARAIWS